MLDDIEVEYYCTCKRKCMYQQINFFNDVVCLSARPHSCAWMRADEMREFHLDRVS